MFRSRSAFGPGPIKAIESPLHAAFEAFGSVGGLRLIVSDGRAPLAKTVAFKAAAGAAWGV